MKKLFIAVALLWATLLSSCSMYDDSALRYELGALEARVAQLEELCSQMNTNIASLQTLVLVLQNNDYVTGVTPITKNGETIGYTIAFAKSQSITIYHGKNGADGSDGTDGTNGTNGNDGHSPIIGVKQDADGVYYWTLDGDWLLDEEGNKIKAEGTDGANGENGSNGENGITPRLKIENDYWYVSYDSGSSWTELGKATGEDGANGESGDSMFASIDTATSSEYVIFTLSDGTEIKLPTWSAFEALRTQCNQLNTNIDSLQALINVLQSYDHIVSVSPLMENGVQVGYTITFRSANPVNIYTHVSAQDAPVIGVKKDADDVYYWTLNGDWLLDDDGNKVKAEGKDGANGSNGSNGSNGENGVTPELKIEEGYWFVSYDGGTSWTKLGKETGADGTDGDSVFASVTQDDECVYFNLSDGTVITVSKRNKENIQFEDLRVKRLICRNGGDKDLDGELSYAEAASRTSLGLIFRDNDNILAFNELKYFTGLTEISNGEFGGCVNLWKITLPDSIEKIGETAFANCKTLRTINIPEGVTSIGEGAFIDCHSLEQISIPSSVVSLGEDCFKGATGSIFIDCDIPYARDIGYGNMVGPFVDASFTSITLGDNVHKIGSSAFSSCSSLVSVTIGESVTTIGNKAFYDCSSLQELYCKPTTPPSIETPVLRSSIESIYVPAEAVDAYKTADGWKDYASKIYPME